MGDEFRFALLEVENRFVSPFTTSVTTARRVTWSPGLTSAGGLRGGSGARDTGVLPVGAGAALELDVVGAGAPGGLTAGGAGSGVVIVTGQATVDRSGVEGADLSTPHEGTAWRTAAFVVGSSNSKSALDSSRL